MQMNTYSEMTPLSFSSKSQSYDFHASTTKNSSNSSTSQMNSTKAYTQTLFDSTNKPYSKSMIEDVAIEMLRMELHDKGTNNYEVRLPYATYTGKNETLEKQHFMKQLEAQKVHDMSNTSDNQFTRWDSMRELRDERFDRIDKVRLYREHQNIWSVYKYGYDKAINLNNGLVYLKSPKLEPSIRSRTNDIAATEAERKTNKNKKKPKRKTKGAQNTSYMLETEFHMDCNVKRRESMMSSHSPPIIDASANNNDKISSYLPHPEDDSSSAGSVIDSLASPHTHTHTQKTKTTSLAPLVPPTPVGYSLFDDSVSLSSLEVIGRVHSDKYIQVSPHIVSQSPACLSDKTPVSSVSALPAAAEARRLQMTNGIESNYCRVTKFFPSTPTNDPNNNCTQLPAVQSQSHLNTAHSSSKPPLPSTGNQKSVIYAQNQAIRNSHHSFLQRQQQYQQHSLPRQSPHYYVKRRPDPDASNSQTKAAPTVRLLPIDANMYFEFTD